MTTSNDATMLGPHGDPIVVIEYRRFGKAGWKPFTVVCGSRNFDFDWCRLDNILAYHESASGGNVGEIYDLGQLDATPKVCAKLWYDHGRCKITYHGKPVTVKQARALGYQVIFEPLNGNPFDDPDSVEDDTTYCGRCGDLHPDSAMCEHVVDRNG